MIALLLNDGSFEQDIRELMMAYFPGHVFSHREEDAGNADIVLRGERRKALPGEMPSAGAMSAEQDIFYMEIAIRPDRFCAPDFSAQKGETACAPDADVTGAEDAVRDACACAPDFTVRKAAKDEIKRTLYRMLRRLTGRDLPWGTLTGIRPTKIALTKLYAGEAPDDIRREMKETYYTGDEKVNLAVEVAAREKELLSVTDPKNGWSLYVGIPFCPTTCLYCSFTSFPIGAWKSRLEDYFEALFAEMDYLAGAMKGRKLQTIYMGGGTPTSLPPEALDRVIERIQGTFPMEDLLEFTVEAGRPDSITEEKLRVLRSHGISRISINPQTMQQKTLDLIGRRHTVEDVVRTFGMAREMGFDNINMDLIVGLPGETAEDVASTIESVRRLGPDSLTVHSLAIKRAARLNLMRERYEDMPIVNTQEMIDMTARAARGMGLNPYYLYRQKNMAGNFENVGYAAPGKECLYNVVIMEEKQTIAACGAGTTTKVYIPEEDRIERAETCKDVATYIATLDEMIARKQRVLHGNETA